MSVRQSVRIEQLGFHRTDFHKIWYKNLLENLPRKFKFHYNLTRIIHILREEVFTFMTISR